jgi:hypothetical protein
MKKVPTLPATKTILAAKGIVKGVSTKAAAEAQLATFYSLPIPKLKVKKALETELTTLHDAIRKFITEHLALFRTATQICLENQPVLKNPTMKSVQILLFATLRDLLPQPPPQLRLIHAGVKVKGVQAGDAGYKERKQGSEAAAKQILSGTTVKDAATWKTFLEKHTKQNDLTDAFCMCINALT